MYICNIFGIITVIHKFMDLCRTSTERNMRRIRVSPITLQLTHLR